MDTRYHYPPDLLNLLVTAIPLLCRSKNDVILFFKGAGVNRALLGDLENRVLNDKGNISKYEITQTVLVRLNERGENFLRERREVLKRVVEFEKFAVCWPADQLKAKGCVAEIRQLVDVKDSFVRMKDERDKEVRARKEAYLKEIEEKRKLNTEKKDLALRIRLLENEPDRIKRGNELANVLNKVFQLDRALIKESFEIRENGKRGACEQIDGVIGIDGELYLVEVKWERKRLDVEDVSRHLVRIIGRGQARGIFISASSYTFPAIEAVRAALRDIVVILCDLEEIASALESGESVIALFKGRVNNAIIYKNPYKKRT